MKTIVANVTEAIFKIWFLFLITHSRCEGQPFGGAIRVRMMRKRMNMPTMAPSLLIRSMSVIFTAFADLTRKITEILQELIITSNIVFQYWGGEIYMKRLSWWLPPPCFEHERPIRESEANLSKPNPECASDYVRPWVEHYCLNHGKDDNDDNVVMLDMWRMMYHLNHA